MTRLTVASWNIFCGKDLPGVIEVLRELDPDVVALQEVLEDVDGSNNDARIIADALGYDMVYVSTHTLTPGDSYLLAELGIDAERHWGNAVLSKYPIKTSAVHTLSEERSRTAIEAVIDINGSELHVFSTHLVYIRTEQPSALQLEQAQNLVKLVPSERALIMGGFNATKDSEVVRAVSSLMQNAEQDSAAPATYKDRRIDYIFLTPDMTAVASGTKDSDASDHLPVYTTLEF